jgi:hypothetical protein
MLPFRLRIGPGPPFGPLAARGTPLTQTQDERGGTRQDRLLICRRRAYSRHSTYQHGFLYSRYGGPNLSDADRAELARILRRAIDADRFPLSPRVQGWKELLTRLDREPPAAAEPYSPPKGWVNSTIGQRKGRGRNRE